jgi:multiple sugar transport system permease protein/putative spermidine/putrescine transport system permease protein
VGLLVVAPLAWPGYVAGGLLSFVTSFEEFEKTFIVGSPVVQTLTILLWQNLGGQAIVFPNAAVVTFILLTPVLLIFALGSWLLRGEGALAAGMGKL